MLYNSRKSKSHGEEHEYCSYEPSLCVSLYISVVQFPNTKRHGDTQQQNVKNYSKWFQPLPPVPQARQYCHLIFFPKTTWVQGNISILIYLCRHVLIHCFETASYVIRSRLNRSLRDSLPPVYRKSS